VLGHGLSPRKPGSVSRFSPSPPVHPKGCTPPLRSSTNGKGAACRLGQQRRRRLGRGLREEASGGSRKVGQSDPRGQHQGGMKRRFTASPGLSMLILKKTAKLDRAPVNGLALFRMAIYSLRPMQTEVTDIHGNVRNSRKPNRR